VEQVVDGVDAVRAAVRDRLRRGAHAIKIMASGGVVSPTDPIRRPQYSAEEIRAVTDEAARRGSYVAAHAYSPEAIGHAVANGVRSIEHGNLITDAAAKLGKQLAQRGIRLVYGGAHVGTMGTLADAALAEGGEVIGVIPTGMV
jgi:imidazolonepropionase-like amidohydrolase